MNKLNNIVRYGKRVINYSIIYTNRRTLEIAVHPNSSVVVTAPKNSNERIIREKIVKRAKWINKQLKYYKQFEPLTPQKQFLNGETHLYFGKQYRLMLKTGQEENVKLKHGYFIIILKDKEDRDRAEKLLYQWYNRKAAEKFNEFFDSCWNNFATSNKTKPILKIRKIKKRWGSLSKSGILTLNIELIKAPKECIEYVITHELCHAVHHNHSQEFYNLLNKKMADWGKRKHKLEIIMA